MWPNNIDLSKINLSKIGLSPDTLKVGGVALIVIGFAFTFYTALGLLLCFAGAGVFWKGLQDSLYAGDADDSAQRETDHRVYGRESRHAFNDDDDENAQSGRGGGKGLKQQGVKDVPSATQKFEQSVNPKENTIKTPQNKIPPPIPKGPGAR